MSHNVVYTFTAKDKAGNTTQAQHTVVVADAPPPPSTILIGATCGNNDGGLNVIADIRRSYNSAWLPSAPDSAIKEASARAKAGGVCWTSYKMDNGTRPTDTALRAQLKALSDFLRIKNQIGWVTFEHEPDIKGTIPPTVYHAGYDQLDPIIAEFDNLMPIVNLTGYTGDKDPSVWETYWRPNHTVIGFDHYNTGHQQTGETLKTPAENYGKFVAWAKTKNKPIAIAETGVGDDAVAGPVIKTRADWYAAHRAYILDPANGFVAASAFDGDISVLNAASAHAWFGV